MREQLDKYYEDCANKHGLKVVELDRDKFYWYTEEEEPYGGWMVTKNDEPIYFSTDEYEARIQLEWVLFGGSEMVDGKLIPVKGFEEYNPPKEKAL